MSCKQFQSWKILLQEGKDKIPLRSCPTNFGVSMFYISFLWEGSCHKSLGNKLFIFLLVWQLVSYTTMQKVMVSNPQPDLWCLKWVRSRRRAVLIVRGLQGKNNHKAKDSWLNNGTCKYWKCTKQLNLMDSEGCPTLFISSTTGNYSINYKMPSYKQTGKAILLTKKDRMFTRHLLLTARLRCTQQNKSLK